MNQPYGQPPDQPGYGQQPPGQPGYGQAAQPGYGQPYPGSGQPHPGSAGPAPVDVQTSFKLWILNVVLGVLAAVLTFFTINDQLALGLDEAARTTPGVTREQLETGLLVAAIAGGVFYLVLLGLMLLFVFKMRAGRNWARIVLTVLGGIGLVFALFGLPGTFALFAMGILGVLVGLLSLVGIVLTAAAIFFMFRPAASAYFR